MRWLKSILWLLVRWWRRNVRKACPWCGTRLLAPPRAEASMASYVAAVCPKAHYAEEVHEAGRRFLYQDGGNPLPFLQEAMGQIPRSGVRPRHLRAVGRTHGD